ncbi:hypothetical protein FAGKG844_90033 [Frankia sp. AgKG'84/4]
MPPSPRRRRTVYWPIRDGSCGRRGRPGRPAGPTGNSVIRAAPETDSAVCGRTPFCGPELRWSARRAEGDRLSGSGRCPSFIPLVDTERFGAVARNPTLSGVTIPGAKWHGHGARTAWFPGSAVGQATSTSVVSRGGRKRWEAEADAPRTSHRRRVPPAPGLTGGAARRRPGWAVARRVLGQAGIRSAAATYAGCPG